VVASGGIADGRGLVAALALGAEGINMGTRFVATQEAPVHENVKKAIVEMKETDTSLIFRSYRNTARVYTNDVARKVLEVEKAGGEFGEIHEYVSGKNQEKAWTTGDVNAGMITFGMCGGLVKDIPTCQELVDEIVSDAKAIINERLSGYAS
jgi:NAD(P)H-dependent flavin oxidoreductase YrpB (nitropropane dioxygenase family)